MSSYGPRGQGGYGDQAGYGDQGGYGGQGGYVQPTYGGQQYRQPSYGPDGGSGPESEWGEPEPPRRHSTMLIVTIFAVTTVLLLGAGAAYLSTRDNNDPTAPASADSTAAAGGEVHDGTVQTEPSVAPSDTEQKVETKATPTPAPEASAEARFAAKGQCLVNDGTNEKPKMRISTCATGTYEVLARFGGTVDFKRECAKVKGYEFHYFFDAELDDLDYVLCLKKR